jgi:cobalt transporter subunit CbtA
LGFGTFESPIMLKRTLIAAILAGLAAGLVMSVLQHWRLTPLIIAAEQYENGAPHDHGAAATPHVHDTTNAATELHDHGDGWAPKDGIERTFFTSMTSILTGVGFAALLAGLAQSLGVTLSRKSGVIMGLCGFFAVSLAPSVGLPPELPGMASATLDHRQAWWILTILATATGLWLMLKRKVTWALPLAILLMALPHIVGAPQPPAEASMVPPSLASSFVANSLAANLIFWCVIGYLLGAISEKQQGDAIK